MTARKGYERAEGSCDLGDRCPNGPTAVQAYELKPNGRRKWEHLTVCVPAEWVAA